MEPLRGSGVWNLVQVDGPVELVGGLACRRVGASAPLFFLRVFFENGQYIFVTDIFVSGVGGVAGFPYIYIGVPAMRRILLYLLLFFFGVTFFASPSYGQIAYATKEEAVWQALRPTNNPSYYINFAMDFWVDIEVDNFGAPNAEKCHIVRGYYLVRYSAGVDIFTLTFEEFSGVVAENANGTFWWNPVGGYFPPPLTKVAHPLRGKIIGSAGFVAYYVAAHMVLNKMQAINDALPTTGPPRYTNFGMDGKLITVLI